MRFSKVIWVTIALGLLSACQSVMDRRVSAHEETWRRLSEQDQRRLSRGFMFVGDTEEMVSIALGQPDRVLAITGQESQKQTVWVYYVLTNSNDISIHSLPTEINERKVIFRDGVVVDRVGFGDISEETLAIFRTRIPDRMTERLDSLVALAPEQKVQARAVFAQANDKLLDLAWNEQASNGKPIGEKMRADIRTILTTDQQAKYDAGATITILGW